MAISIFYDISHSTAVNTCLIMCYMLGQYSPYTFTVAILDTTDPASLLTLHLYMYCPIASVASVVYDVVLSLLTVVQLLPEFLSQEYTSTPTPFAPHIRIILLLTGISLLLAGWCVILGRPINTCAIIKYVST